MRSPELRVRVGLLADVPEIVALERSVSEAPHWSEAEYVAMAGPAEGAGGIERRLLVAASGEQLAGFAVGKLVRWEGVGEAEIESVAVTPELRRSGIGRALCAAILAWCVEQQVGHVELEVRAGSRGAIALYRSLGFQEIGLRPGYYHSPPEAAILMRLELGACGERSLPVD